MTKVWNNFSNSVKLFFFFWISAAFNLLREKNHFKKCSSQSPWFSWSSLFKRSFFLNLFKFPNLMEDTTIHLIATSSGAIDSSPGGVVMLPCYALWQSFHWGDRRGKREGVLVKGWKSQRPFGVWPGSAGSIPSLSGAFLLQLCFWRLTEQRGGVQ